MSEKFDNSLLLKWAMSITYPLMQVLRKLHFKLRGLDKKLGFYICLR